MGGAKCLERGFLDRSQHGEKHLADSLVTVVPCQRQFGQNFNLCSIFGGDHSHIIFGGDHFTHARPCAYHATEGYYQNIGEDGFTEADHIRLRDALMRIEGKFLLSYNDDAFVRGLYDRPGIYLMETTRINNIKQRYDNGAQFPELLIANYDLRERSRAVPSQMTLFDWNGGEAIG